MEMKRCDSCFREYEGDLCPHCGGAQNGPHQLPVGTVLRDRYKLGRVLGQGGFGITYLGWDTLMQRPIAVKEFYPSGTVFRRTQISTEVQCDNQDMVPHYEYSKERFLREAQALVRFRDIPEIVDIQDFIRENNTAYIIMEYVRGMDLAKYIRLKGGRLSPDETFRILRPIMEALAKVHRGGIVHRDISPDNIILDPMGGAKLLDFGAVRAVEDPDVDKGLNKSTEAILKQGFAPIEQYNTRGSLGPWTDEYALCATVWYCLTGEIPTEVSLRMAEGIDPDWSSIEGLPEHQQKALEKGFRCRAKDRYKTVDELLADLFPEEAAPAIPEPAEDAPVERAAKKAKAPEKSGKKFWTVFTTAILALWLLLAVLIPKEIKTEAEEPVPQETAPTQTETQPTKPLETEPPTVPLSPEEEAYAHAEALLEEGKLGEAAIAFGKLAGFSDARERSFEIWDKITVREAISAGHGHTVGLKADGTVIAVGDNADDQCNTNSWTNIVAVSAGWNHTIGLKEDGTVIATGNNEDGQCDVENWTDIVMISAGIHYTLGLRVDGTVIAVGENDRDQHDVSSWANIVMLAAGGYHSVGLRSDGSVVAVGGKDIEDSSNYTYDCGQTHVSDLTDIVAIVAGSQHTVGLKSDGSIIAVGRNVYGQCNIENWNDIVRLCAGNDHTIGLRADGTVCVAGTNTTILDEWKKKHGVGTYKGGRCDVGDWTDIIAISAGDHTVGLKSDGTVLAVGDNTYGQCDVGEWTNIMIPTERVPFR